MEHILTMTCPYCNKVHTADVRYCPYSGKKIREREKIRTSNIEIGNDLFIILIKILDNFKDKDSSLKTSLEIAPNFSSKTLIKVVSIFDMGDDTEIFGIINTSLQFSSEYIVFEKKGIYYNNFWLSETAGVTFVSYDEFTSYNIYREKTFEIALGDRLRIDVTKFCTSSDTIDKVVELLKIIKDKIIKYSSPEYISKEHLMILEK
jgi:hypothetical protein